MLASLKYEAIATSSATTSSVVDERERCLQRRRQRERSHQRCETAEEREEHLRKLRARNRARHAAQTSEQRQLCNTSTHCNLPIIRSCSPHNALHSPSNNDCTCWSLSCTISDSDTEKGEAEDEEEESEDEVIEVSFFSLLLDKLLSIHQARDKAVR